MRSFTPLTIIMLSLVGLVSASATPGLLPGLPDAPGEAAPGSLKPHRTTDPDPRMLEVLEQMGDYGFALGPGLNPMPAGHGFHSCGEDIALVFRNPDLQPHEDGYVRASGRLFIQFQAIGDRALDIEEFSFSFGKPIPESMHTCDTPEWVTGAYYKDYRMDRDPQNGFFVPVNTSLVPDGEYAAAVSAYDAQGNELTRYWVSAFVENGCEVQCRMEDESSLIQNDGISPWPRILPGDGEQVNEVGGLTIEFAENLARTESGEYDILAWMNGVRVPIQEWEGNLMNDDPLPDGAGVGYEYRKWGPAFHWNGVIRDGDIIRVRATDVNGNQAEKILHLGDPTIGGRIPLEFPELEIVGNGQSKVARNGTARFPFEFHNTGDGALHGDILMAELPESLRASFDRDHIMMGAHKVHHANLTVTAFQDLQPGTYTIEGRVAYQKGSIMMYEPFNVEFRLEERSSFTRDDEEVTTESRVERQDPPPIEDEVETNAEDEEASRGLPAPGALVVLAGAAGLAAVLPRRRRG